MSQINRIRRLERANSGHNGEKKQLTPTEGIYEVIRAHMARTHVIIPHADVLAAALAQGFEISTMRAVHEALRRYREEQEAQDAGRKTEGTADGDQG